MKADFIIENAKITDIDSILRIESVCFDSDGFSKTQFRYLITKAKGAFFIIKHSGNAVAYISLLKHSHRNNLRIYSIAVHPDERGKGLAQILIDRSVEYAKKNNLSSISLEVRKNNISAIKLYEKKGFYKTSLKYNYYSDGSDAEIFNLPI